MATSIQVSLELLDELKGRKLHPRESYEDVINDLLEDSMELSSQAKKEIAQARKEIKSGRFYTLDQVREGL